MDDNTNMKTFTRTESLMRFLFNAPKDACQWDTEDVDEASKLMTEYIAENTVNNKACAMN